MGPNPHNFLLKNAIDLGVPGLALYLLILGMLAARIRGLRKVHTREARMFALCLTLLLSIALTNALYEPTLEGWVYGSVFWMLAGALYAASDALSLPEGPVA
jgi:O-antigen ligase